MSFRHVEEAVQLIQTPRAAAPGNRAADRVSDRSVDAPGHFVERDGARLVLRTGASGGTETMSAFRYRLPVPGAVELAEAGCVVSAEPVAAGHGPEALRATAGNRASAVVATAGPLAVRNRRPGDRFRPLGAPGRRKLQDVFIDRKVPRAERDRVPLIVDADDKIVWVAGLAVAHDCRVTAPEDGVLILEKRTAE